VAPPRLGDEAAPDVARDLVGGVAAEAVEAEGEQVLDDAEEVGLEPLPIAAVGVVELPEVAPHHAAAAVLHAGRVGDVTILEPVPLGVLHRQRRVDGAVVDDEVDHHAQAEIVRRGESGVDLRLGTSLRGRIDQPRVPVEVVGDRVDAPGSPRPLDRVDEDPVEFHLRRAHQVR
jgi:hypothetical protein